MPRKITLVNAPAERIKEKHYEQPDIPRIGLAYLASYLVSLGIACSVIDAKYDRLDQEKLKEEIERTKPHIVGFTAMTTEIIDTAKVAKDIKKKHPNIKIIIGGPHATALPVETLKEFPAFDIACMGEGEYTLKEISNLGASSKDLENIAGIAYKDEDGIIRKNSPRPFIEKLDSLPSPAWHLFKPAKKYPILASRGCPFRCNFCMRVLGDRIRFRDPDLVIEEMENIYETYKPSLFEFYDETFGVDKAKTERLLDNIIEKGLHKKIKWHIQTRVDVVTGGLLKKMKEAGCAWVGFGVESGNEDILKATNKNITKEKVRDAIRMAKDASLDTGSFFILGHPGETKKTAKETIDFALELNTTTVAFGIMTPYPGTEIARMAEEGRGGYKLLSKKWSDYNKQTNDMLELEGIDSETLQKYQLIGYLKFYLFHPSISKIKSLLSFVDLKSLFIILFKRIFRIKDGKS